MAESLHKGVVGAPSGALAKKRRQVAHALEELADMEEAAAKKPAAPAPAPKPAPAPAPEPEASEPAEGDD
jgi:hypothetical protein